MPDSSLSSSGCANFSFCRFNSFISSGVLFALVRPKTNGNEGPIAEESQQQRRMEREEGREGGNRAGEERAGLVGREAEEREGARAPPARQEEEDGQANIVEQGEQGGGGGRGGALRARIMSVTRTIVRKALTHHSIISVPLQCPCLPAFATDQRDWQLN